MDGWPIRRSATRYQDNRLRVLPHLICETPGVSNLRFGLFTLQLGLVVGLIYLALRALAIGPAWFRIASLTAAGTVIFGALIIHQDGVDFTLLDPAWLPVVLFLVIPLVYVLTAAIITERWLRPASWFLTADIRKVAAVLVLWISTGPLLVLPAIGLGAAYLVRSIGSRMSPTARSTVAWLTRLGFGALGVLALLALLPTSMP